METSAAQQAVVSSTSKEQQEAPVFNQSGSTVQSQNNFSINPRPDCHFGTPPAHLFENNKPVQIFNHSCECQNSPLAPFFDFLTPPVSIPKPTLDVEATGDGQLQVTTEDGYTLNFTGKKESWTITSPDGKETLIWGDPHVVESDGDKWDFTEQSSFSFGNNKVTVETIEKGPGVYTQAVTIYNGDDRVTISGIDSNKLSLDAWSFDGVAHDGALEDGVGYSLLDGEGDAFSWEQVLDESNSDSIEAEGEATEDEDSDE